MHLPGKFQLDSFLALHTILFFIIFYFQKYLRNSFRTTVKIGKFRVNLIINHFVIGLKN